MDEDETYSNGSEEDYDEENLPLPDEEDDYASDTSEWENDDALQGEEEQEEPQGQGRAESAAEGSNYPAASREVSPFTDEALEEYADRMGWTPDQTAVAGHMMAQMINYYTRANSVVQQAVAREASTAPEFFREYGPRITNHLERVDPSQRGERKMVQLAAVITYLEQAKDTDDLKTIVAGLHRKLSGQRSQPAASTGRREVAPSAPAPAPARAAGQQTPTPSRSAGRATRPASRDTTTSSFMRRFGVSGIHARDIEYALKTKDGWR